MQKNRLKKLKEYEDWVYEVETVDIETLGGYTFEEVMNNRNCSKEPVYWKQIKDTDKFLFKSKVAESWEFFDHEIENPIRNTDQIYLRFKDVSKFVEPSNFFRENKTYTLFPIDTMPYDNYWDDIESKCENGFVHEGVRITGRHFFTINFGRFLVIPVDKAGNKISSRKKHDFMKFIDFQYYIFHELEECFLEGYYKTFKEYKKWLPNKTKKDFAKLSLKSFGGTKSRRKGWTAIIGTGVLEYNFTFIPSSVSILAAYDKSHYGPMQKSFINTKSFVDDNTPWIRVTDILGKRDHMISGINYTNELGIKVSKGYLSEFNAVTFKDNPFKGIGESATVINVEEPGKFDKLLETYPVSFEPLIREGETTIGSVLMVGTAGDLEGGGSIGLEEIVYNPESYGFKSYRNIYEETEREELVGFFIDDLWFSPKLISKEDLLKLDNSERTNTLLSKFKGDFIDTVDNNGNSYRYFSELILNKKREQKRKTSISSFQKFITQQPRYLSEAFLVNENSPFNVATAKEALSDLNVHYDKIRRDVGFFSLDKNNEPSFIPEFGANYIDEFPWKGKSTEGNWVLYERPVKINGIIPPNRYIAGNDPIDFGTEEKNNARTHSLAATYIIDSLTRNVVAEYVSRPRLSDHYFEQLWRALDYYNAVLMYENNLKGLYSYFKQKNKVYLLAGELSSLKDKHGYKANPYSKGFHATKEINKYARELINKWSMEPVQTGFNKETGEPKLSPRMFLIKSKALLQEIIRWNEKGNFDRISGLGAAMLLLFDRYYENLQEEDPKDSFFNQELFKKASTAFNSANNIRKKQDDIFRRFKQ